MNNKYFYITSEGTIARGVSKIGSFELERMAIGNHFKTLREAEFVLNRLRVLALLKEHSSPCEPFKSFYMYVTPYGSVDVSIWNASEVNYRMFYFESREKAFEALNLIGEDILLEYYFNVPAPTYEIPLEHLVTSNGNQQYVTQKGQHLFACKINPDLKQTFTHEELQNLPPIYQDMAREVDSH